MSIRTGELLIPERMDVLKTEIAADYTGALPDDRPDAARVVRVDCRPVSDVCEIDGETATVRGRAIFTFLYETALKNKLKSCVFTTGFTAEIPLPRRENGEITAHCRVYCERISCRLEDPRTVSISSLLTAELYPVCTRAQRYIVPEDGGEACFKKTAVGFVGAEKVLEYDFEFDERPALTQNERPIGDAAAGRIELSPARITVSNSAAEIKTSAGIGLIYEDEDEEGVYRSTVKTVPLTMRCEGAGIGENARVSAELYPTECFVGADYDQYGESRIIDAKFKVRAVLHVSEPAACSVAADMFESGCESELEFAELTLPHPAECFEKSFVAETEIAPAAPYITAILDSAAFCRGGSAERAEGGAVVRGTVNLCITGDSESGIVSRTAQIQYEQFLQCEFPAGTGEITAEVNALDVNAALHGDGAIYARVNCEARICAFSKSKARFVCGAESTRQVEPAPEGALIFRFPASGEQLWDIAKEYRTAPESIVAANPKRFDESGACVGTEPVLIV